MADDLELELWRQQWQAQDAIPPDVRHRVEADTRKMRRWRFAEIINAALFCGGSLAAAIAIPRVEIVVLAVGIWLLVAVAWATSVTLAYGVWAPAADTTSAYLDLSILRVHRQLRGLAAQCALYVVILVFDFAWLAFYFRGRRTLGELFTSSPAIAVWIVTVVLAAIAIHRGRGLRRELRNLHTLQRQLMCNGSG